MLSSGVREDGALGISLYEVPPASTRHSPCDEWTTRRLRVVSAFIPPEGILQADVASLFQPGPDWHLVPSVFCQVVSLWGTPQIDLFASRQSALLARSLSWRSAVLLEAIGALSRVWDFSLAFLLPPFPLLWRVVWRLEVSGGVFPLVSPLWEAQVLFAGLQSLPVLEVRRLPFHDALVVVLATGDPPQSL